MYSFFQKNKSGVALLTSVLFLVTNCLWSPDLFAFAVSGHSETPLPYQAKLDSTIRFSIPQQLGKIDEFHLGKGGQPAVIHIQTAHGHYEAQQQIRKILHHLTENYGIKTILVEGSAFKLQPEILNFFPEDPKLTIKVNEELARHALVKGPELYLLEAKDAQAYGIERAQEYRENGYAFVDVLTQKEKTVNFLAYMNDGIDRLSAPYLNNALRTFLKRQEAFEKNLMPLDAWLSYLKEQAQKLLKLDLEDVANQVEWPMLVRLFKIQELSAELDRTKFPKERSEFLNAIKRFLPTNHALYEEIEQLLENESIAQQLSDPETSLLFENMVKTLPRNFNYNAFPNVRYYIGLLLLQSELQATVLMGESQNLTDRILNKLTKSRAEKQLIGLLKDHRLLQRLFALELTPVDYEEIEKRDSEGGESLKPSGIVKRFGSIIQHLPSGVQRVKEVAFEHIDELDELYSKAMAFYAGVKTRDGVMEEMVEKRLKETGADKVAVITGGFHSEPFKNYFSSQDYTYALISPKINGADKQGYDEYVRNTLTSTLYKKATREFAYASLPHNELVEMGVDPVRLAGAVVRAGVPVIGSRDDQRAFELQMKNASGLETRRSEIRQTPGQGENGKVSRPVSLQMIRTIENKSAVAARKGGFSLDEQQDLFRLLEENLPGVENESMLNALWWKVEDAKLFTEDLQKQLLKKFGLRGAEIVGLSEATTVDDLKALWWRNDGNFTRSLYLQMKDEFALRAAEIARKYLPRITTGKELNLLWMKSERFWDANFDLWVSMHKEFSSRAVMIAREHLPGITNEVKLNALWENLEKFFEDDLETQMRKEFGSRAIVISRMRFPGMATEERGTFWKTVEGFWDGDLWSQMYDEFFGRSASTPNVSTPLRQEREAPVRSEARIEDIRRVAALYKTSWTSEAVELYLRGEMALPFAAEIIRRKWYGGTWYFSSALAEIAASRIALDNEIFDLEAFTALKTILKAYWRGDSSESDVARWLGGIPGLNLSVVLAQVKTLQKEEFGELTKDGQQAVQWLLSQAKSPEQLIPLVRKINKEAAASKTQVGAQASRSEARGMDRTVDIKTFLTKLLEEMYGSATYDNAQALLREVKASEVFDDLPPSIADDMRKASGWPAHIEPFYNKNRENIIRELRNFQSETRGGIDIKDFVTRLLNEVGEAQPLLVEFTHSESFDYLQVRVQNDIRQVLVGMNADGTTAEEFFDKNFNDIVQELMSRLEMPTENLSQKQMPEIPQWMTLPEAGEFLRSVPELEELGIATGFGLETKSAQMLISRILAQVTTERDASALRLDLAQRAEAAIEKKIVKINEIHAIGDAGISIGMTLPEAGEFLRSVPELEELGIATGFGLETKSAQMLISRILAQVTTERDANALRLDLAQRAETAIWKKTADRSEARSGKKQAVLEILNEIDSTTVRISKRVEQVTEKMREEHFSLLLLGSLIFDITKQMKAEEMPSSTKEVLSVRAEILRRIALEKCGITPTKPFSSLFKPVRRSEVRSLQAYIDKKEVYGLRKSREEIDEMRVSEDGADLLLFRKNRQVYAIQLKAPSRVLDEIKALINYRAIRAFEILASYDLVLVLENGAKLLVKTGSGNVYYDGSDLSKPITYYLQTAGKNLLIVRNDFPERPVYVYQTHSAEWQRQEIGTKLNEIGAKIVGWRSDEFIGGRLEFYTDQGSMLTIPAGGGEVTVRSEARGMDRDVDINTFVTKSLEEIYGSATYDKAQILLRKVEAAEVFDDLPPSIIFDMQRASGWPAHIEPFYNKNRENIIRELRNFRSESRASNVTQLWQQVARERIEQDPTLSGVGLQELDELTTVLEFVKPSRLSDPEMLQAFQFSVSNFSPNLKKVAAATIDIVQADIKAKRVVVTPVDSWILASQKALLKEEKIEQWKAVTRSEVRTEKEKGAESSDLKKALIMAVIFLAGWLPATVFQLAGYTFASTALWIAVGIGVVVTGILGVALVRDAILTTRSFNQGMREAEKNMPALALILAKQKTGRSEAQANDLAKTQAVRFLKTVQNVSALRVFLMFRFMTSRKISAIFEALTPDEITALFESLKANKISAIFMGLTSGLSSRKVSAFFEALTPEKISAMFEVLTHNTFHISIIFWKMEPSDISAMIKAMTPEKISKMFEALTASGISALFRALTLAKGFKMFRVMTSEQFLAMARALTPEKFLNMHGGFLSEEQKTTLHQVFQEKLRAAAGDEARVRSEVRENGAPVITGSELHDVISKVFDLHQRNSALLKRIFDEVVTEDVLVAEPDVIKAAREISRLYPDEITKENIVTYLREDESAWMIDFFVGVYEALSSEKTEGARLVRAILKASPAQIPGAFQKMKPDQISALFKTITPDQIFEVLWPLTLQQLYALGKALTKEKTSAMIEAMTSDKVAAFFETPKLENTPGLLGGMPIDAIALVPQKFLSQELQALFQYAISRKEQAERSASTSNASTPLQHEDETDVRSESRTTEQPVVTGKALYKAIAKMAKVGSADEASHKILFGMETVASNFAKGHPGELTPEEITAYLEQTGNKEKTAFFLTAYNSLADTSTSLQHERNARVRSEMRSAAEIASTYLSLLDQLEAEKDYDELAQDLLDRLSQRFDLEDMLWAGHESASAIGKMAKPFEGSDSEITRPDFSGLIIDRDGDIWLLSKISRLTGRDSKLALVRSGLLNAQRENGKIVGTERVPYTSASWYSGSDLGKYLDEQHFVGILTHEDLVRLSNPQQTSETANVSRSETRATELPVITVEELTDAAYRAVLDRAISGMDMDEFFQLSLEEMRISHDLTSRYSGEITQEDLSDYFARNAASRQISELYLRTFDKLSLEKTTAGVGEMGYLIFDHPEASKRLKELIPEARIRNAWRCSISAFLILTSLSNNQRIRKEDIVDFVRRNLMPLIMADYLLGIFSSAQKNEQKERLLALKQRNSKSEKVDTRSEARATKTSADILRQPLSSIGVTNILGHAHGAFSILMDTYTTLTQGGVQTFHDAIDLINEPNLFPGAIISNNAERRLLIRSLIARNVPPEAFTNLGALGIGFISGTVASIHNVEIKNLGALIRWFNNTKQFMSEFQYDPNVRYEIARVLAFMVPEEITIKAFLDAVLVSGHFTEEGELLMGLVDGAPGNNQPLSSLFQYYRSELRDTLSYLSDAQFEKVVSAMPSGSRSEIRSETMSASEAVDLAKEICSASSESISTRFRKMSPDEISAFFDALTAKRIFAMFRQLKPDQISALFKVLAPDQIYAIFWPLTPEKISALFDALTPEKISKMAETLTPKKVSAMLSAMGTARKKTAMFSLMTAKEFRSMIEAMKLKSALLLPQECLSEEQQGIFDDVIGQKRRGNVRGSATKRSEIRSPGEEAELNDDGFMSVIRSRDVNEMAKYILRVISLMDLAIVKGEADYQNISVWAFAMRYATPAAPSAANVFALMEKDLREIAEHRRGWLTKRPKGTQIVDLMAKRDRLPDEADLLVAFGSGNPRVAEEAAKLFHERKIANVLVAGKYGKHIVPNKDNPDFGVNPKTETTVEAEALIYKRILVENGVPENVILVEKESQDMTENGANSVKVLKEAGISPKTIIFMHAPLLQIRGSLALRDAISHAEMNAQVYDYAAPVLIDPDKDINAIIWQAGRLTDDAARIIGARQLAQVRSLLEALKTQTESRAEVRSLGEKAELSEIGYWEVALSENVDEMAKFVLRVIRSMGYELAKGDRIDYENLYVSAFARHYLAPAIQSFATMKENIHRVAVTQDWLTQTKIKRRSELSLREEKGWGVDVRDFSFRLLEKTGGSKARLLFMIQDEESGEDPMRFLLSKVWEVLKDMGHSNIVPDDFYPVIKKHVIAELNLRSEARSKRSDVKNVQKKLAKDLLLAKLYLSDRKSVGSIFALLALGLSSFATIFSILKEAPTVLRLGDSLYLGALGMVVAGMLPMALVGAKIKAYQEVWEGRILRYEDPKVLPVLEKLLERVTGDHQARVNARIKYLKYIFAKRSGMIGNETKTIRRAEIRHSIDVNQFSTWLLGDTHQTPEGLRDELETSTSFDGLDNDLVKDRIEKVLFDMQILGDGETDENGNELTAAMIFDEIRDDVIQELKERSEVRNGGEVNIPNFTTQLLEGTSDTPQGLLNEIEGSDSFDDLGDFYQDSIEQVLINMGILDGGVNDLKERELAVATIFNEIRGAVIRELKNRSEMRGMDIQSFAKQLCHKADETPQSLLEEIESKPFYKLSDSLRKGIASVVKDMGILKQSWKGPTANEVFAYTSVEGFFNDFQSRIIEELKKHSTTYEEYDVSIPDFVDKFLSFTGKDPTSLLKKMEEEKFFENLSDAIRDNFSKALDGSTSYFVIQADEFFTGAREDILKELRSRLAPSAEADIASNIETDLTRSETRGSTIAVAENVSKDLLLGLLLLYLSFYAVFSPMPLEGFEFSTGNYWDTASFTSFESLLSALKKEVLDNNSTYSAYLTPHGRFIRVRIDEIASVKEIQGVLSALNELFEGSNLSDKVNAQKHISTIEYSKSKAEVAAAIKGAKQFLATVRKVEPRDLEERANLMRSEEREKSLLVKNALKGDIINIYHIAFQRIAVSVVEISISFCSNGSWGMGKYVATPETFEEVLKRELDDKGVYTGYLTIVGYKAVITITELASERAIKEVVNQLEALRLKTPESERRLGAEIRGRIAQIGMASSPILNAEELLQVLNQAKAFLKKQSELEKSNSQKTNSERSEIRRGVLVADRASKRDILTTFDDIFTEARTVGSVEKIKVTIYGLTKPGSEMSFESTPESFSNDVGKELDDASRYDGYVRADLTKEKRETKLNIEVKIEKVLSKADARTETSSKKTNSERSEARGTLLVYAINVLKPNIIAVFGPALEQMPFAGINFSIGHYWGETSFTTSEDFLHALEKDVLKHGLIYTGYLIFHEGFVHARIEEVSSKKEIQATLNQLNELWDAADDSERFEVLDHILKIETAKTGGELLGALGEAEIFLADRSQTQLLDAKPIGPTRAELRALDVKDPLAGREVTDFLREKMLGLLTGEIFVMINDFSRPLIRATFPASKALFEKLGDLLEDETFYIADLYTENPDLPDASDDLAAIIMIKKFTTADENILRLAAEEARSQLNELYETVQAQKPDSKKAFNILGLMAGIGLAMQPSDPMDPRELAFALKRAKNFLDKHYRSEVRAGEKGGIQIAKNASDEYLIAQFYKKLPETSPRGFVDFSILYFGPAGTIESGAAVTYANYASFLKDLPQVLDPRKAIYAGFFTLWHNGIAKVMIESRVMDRSIQVGRFERKTSVRSKRNSRSEMRGNLGARTQKVIEEEILPALRNRMMPYKLSHQGTVSMEESEIADVTNAFRIQVKKMIGPFFLTKDSVATSEMLRFFYAVMPQNQYLNEAKVIAAYAEAFVGQYDRIFREDDPNIDTEALRKAREIFSETFASHLEALGAVAEELPQDVLIENLSSILSLPALSGDDMIQPKALVFVNLLANVASTVPYISSWKMEADQSARIKLRYFQETLIREAKALLAIVDARKNANASPATSLVRSEARGTPLFSGNREKEKVIRAICDVIAKNEPNIKTLKVQISFLNEHSYESEPSSPDHFEEFLGILAHDLIDGSTYAVSLEILDGAARVFIDEVSEKDIAKQTVSRLIDEWIKADESKTSDSGEKSINKIRSLIEAIERAATKEKMDFAIKNAEKFLQERSGMENPTRAETRSSKTLKQQIITTISVNDSKQATIDALENAFVKLSRIDIKFLADSSRESMPISDSKDLKRKLEEILNNGATYTTRLLIQDNVAVAQLDELSMNNVVQETIEKLEEWLFAIEREEHPNWKLDQRIWGLLLSLKFAFSKAEVNTALENIERFSSVYSSEKALVRSEARTSKTPAQIVRKDHPVVMGVSIEEMITKLAEALKGIPLSSIRFFIYSQERKSSSKENEEFSKPTIVSHEKLTEILEPALNFGIKDAVYNVYLEIRKGGKARVKIIKDLPWDGAKIAYHLHGAMAKANVGSRVEIAARLADLKTANKNRTRSEVRGNEEILDLLASIVENLQALRFTYLKDHWLWPAYQAAETGDWNAVLEHVNEARRSLRKTLLSLSAGIKGQIPRRSVNTALNDLGKAVPLIEAAKARSETRETLLAKNVSKKDLITALYNAVDQMPATTYVYINLKSGEGKSKKFGALAEQLRQTLKSALKNSDWLQELPDDSVYVLSQFGSESFLIEEVAFQANKAADRSEARGTLLAENVLKEGLLAAFYTAIMSTRGESNGFVDLVELLAGGLPELKWFQKLSGDSVYSLYRDRDMGLIIKAVTSRANTEKVWKELVALEKRTPLSQPELRKEIMDRMYEFGFAMESPITDPQKVVDILNRTKKFLTEEIIHELDALADRTKGDVSARIKILDHIFELRSAKGKGAREEIKALQSAREFLTARSEMREPASVENVSKSGLITFLYGELEKTNVAKVEIVVKPLSKIENELGAETWQPKAHCASDEAVEYLSTTLELNDDAVYKAVFKIFHKSAQLRIEEVIASSNSNVTAEKPVKSRSEIRDGEEGPEVPLTVSLPGLADAAPRTDEIPAEVRVIRALNSETSASADLHQLVNPEILTLIREYYFRIAPLRVQQGFKTSGLKNADEAFMTLLKAVGVVMPSAIASMPETTVLGGLIPGERNLVLSNVATGAVTSSAAKTKVSEAKNVGGTLAIGQDMLKAFINENPRALYYLLKSFALSSDSPALVTIGPSDLISTIKKALLRKGVVDVAEFETLPQVLQALEEGKVLKVVELKAGEDETAVFNKMAQEQEGGMATLHLSADALSGLKDGAHFAFGENLGSDDLMVASALAIAIKSLADLIRNVPDAKTRGELLTKFVTENLPGVHKSGVNAFIVEHVAQLAQQFVVQAAIAKSA